MDDTVRMSHAETTPSPAAYAHDAGHGHEPSAEPLGPIDLKSWAYAVAGGAVGVVVAVVLFVAGNG